MDYRYGSHTVVKIEYHFVWVTKYRYKVLRGDVGQRVRELVRQTCEAFEIRILKGVVSADHVHILMSAPPDVAPSEIMRRIKGRSASKLFEEFSSLKKRYWGRHFWARGYFCATVGEMTETMIAEGLVHKPGQGPLERWGIGANVLTISETYFRSSEGDSPGGRSYEQAHRGVSGTSFRT